LFLAFSPRKVIGIALTLFGVFVAVFSPKMVFPGLERLVGIEIIVDARGVKNPVDSSPTSSKVAP
jgi:hypothetical protein